MQKCSNGELLQSCAGSSDFIYDCHLEHEYSRYEELRNSDLTPYCLIGTFLSTTK